MKHATSIGLDALEPLLRELRRLAALTERKRGVFYRGSRAFVHFHEDPAGFFADVRLDAVWMRREDTSRAQQRALVRDVARATSPPAPLHGVERGDGRRSAGRRVTPESKRPSDDE